MDNDVLIGLFVLALVILQVVNTIATNRGNASLWTKVAETIDTAQQNTDQSTLIEKAMTKVIPVELAAQIVAGSQDVGSFIKRLTSSEVDRVVDALLAYQKTVLDGVPNTSTEPPPSPPTVVGGQG